MFPHKEMVSTKTRIVTLIFLDKNNLLDTSLYRLILTKGGELRLKWGWNLLISNTLKME